MKTYDEIVNDIKKSKDANVVKGTLRKIAVSEGNGGTQKVTIEIDKDALKKVNVDSEGSENEVLVPFCNLSSYGFWASLRESRLKPVVKKIRRDYDLLDILLDNATIEITQVKVPAKTDYVNPFSEDTTKTVKFDNTKYISFVTNVILSKDGEEDLRQMKKYMLMGCKE